MATVTKYGIIAAIAFLVLYLFIWTIAGFPVDSKERVVDSVIDFYEKNEAELQTIVKVVSDIKEAFPNVNLKIDSYGKQFDCRLYIEDGLGDGTYFKQVDFKFPQNLHRRLLDLNIQEIKVIREDVQLKLNKSPSKNSDIYLIHFGQENNADMATKQAHWTHRINKNWIIEAKKI